MDTIARLFALRDSTFEYAVSEPIRLADFGVLEDTKHEWLTKPITDLHRALDRVAEIDLLDDRSVGRRLPKRSKLLAGRAEAVAELAEFLAHFESQLIGLIRLAAINALDASTLLVRALADPDDTTAGEAQGAFEAVMSDVADDRVLLAGAALGSVESFGFSGYTWHEMTALLVGVELDPDTPWRESIDRLRANGADIYEIGRRQLGQLGPSPSKREGFDENYLKLALRLGHSRFPLLAHRAAHLATSLANRAVDADRDAAQHLVATFFRDEAGWITASASQYEEALGAFMDNDDRLAIMEAYRLVSESVLRPYGSLLVSLHALSEGRPLPEPGIAPTLGDLLQRFAPLIDPAIRLLGSFVRPALRNAQAHARIAVGGAGELIAREADGTTTVLIPNHVYGVTAGLRSALDGVDVAINVLYVRDLADDLDPEKFQPAFVSEEMLRFFATLAAGEHTRGWVTGVESREGTVTITFVGEGSDPEFEAMLRHLHAALRGGVDELILAAEDGRVLGRLATLPT